MKRLIFSSFLATVALAGTVPVITAVTAQHALAAGSLGDLSSLQARITDFETLWDKDEETMKPMNKKAWHHVDDAADAALKALRTKKPEASEVASTLSALDAALANP